MISLRQFIETQQERTLAARRLLLPLLSMHDDEAPWTSAALERLHERRAELDPAARRALEHLHRFEVPLLQREETLDTLGLDHPDFEAGLLRFERLFWEARYGEASAADAADEAGAGPDIVCPHHGVRAEAVRRLARDEGEFDVGAVTRRTGASATCGTCRLAITRILVDELRLLKADAAPS